MLSLLWVFRSPIHVGFLELSSLYPTQWVTRYSWMWSGSGTKTNFNHALFHCHNLLSKLIHTELPLPLNHDRPSTSHGAGEPVVREPQPRPSLQQLPQHCQEQELQGQNCSALSSSSSPTGTTSQSNCGSVSIQPVTRSGRRIITPARYRVTWTVLCYFLNSSFHWFNLVNCCKIYPT